MSAASKALAALLRDSEEWREFFKTCAETSAFRLRVQARQQFRDELSDRGYAFSPVDMEDAMLTATRKLLPDSPAAQWDNEWADGLLKDALARLAEQYAGLTAAEKDTLDLFVQLPWEERMHDAGLANDPAAFREALRGWEHVTLKALEKVRAEEMGAA